MNTDTVIEDRVITIDYGMSLRDMIAAGKYDRTNEYITAEKFPVQGLGSMQFEARLFHFDRSTSSEKAIDLIACNASWEPAKLEHLLAYGAAYPEDQRQYSIIALGSVAEVRGLRHVPCLFQGGAERDLELGWWGGGWRGYCRFLAVRKQSSAA
jgi:hypothetical protein